ncbi:hypothetical protein FACS1894151_03590 [Spirochaetia bacterium]|nr:hypothetical protein FACS1894151_03590 [Spirochaetia bacterium]
MLEDRKLFLLLVFEVLKLWKQKGDRAEIARDLTRIMGDIIGSIDRGVASGLLTAEDKDNMVAIETKLTAELYDEQTIREVNMSDETAIAELRQTLKAIHEKHELIRQLAEKDRLQQEQARQLAEKDRLQQEKDLQLAEERRLQQEKDEVILELKRQLEEARQQAGSRHE